MDERSEEDWKAELSPEAFYVLREEGTERAWSSPLNDVTEAGTFCCSGCGAPMFTTSTKFDSGTGWPSFYAPIDGLAVELRTDYKLLLPRTEVRCAACSGHLGHVFDDGPRPTGERYCLNGVALDFRADAANDALAKEVAARADAAAPVKRPLATVLPSVAVNAVLSLCFFASFAARSEQTPPDAPVLAQAFAYFPLAAGLFYARLAAKPLL